MEEKGSDANQNAYKKSIPRIDEVLCAENEATIESLASELNEFLLKKKWRVGHLVAAAYVCNKVTAKASNDLRAAVFDCVQQD